MKQHFPSRTIAPRRSCLNHSATFKAASLGLIALLVVPQAGAEGRIFGGSGGQDQVEVSAEQVAPKPSTPAPAPEEANLASPQGIPFLALEAGQNGGESSSQDAAQNAPVPSGKTPAARTKPPHHALGVTLAIVGTAALVAGAVLFAGEESIGFCNGASKGCNEAKDTGLALMPIGGVVAVTGFYLQFHR
jgi:hypothetical protein